MERMRTSHDFPSRSIRGMRAGSDAPKVLLRAVCPLCRTTVEKYAIAETAELTCGHCGMCFPYKAAGSQRGDSVRRLHSADTLERWLAGDPMDALPRNNAPRLGRWCRNRRWSTALPTATGALLLVAAALGVAAYWHARVQVGQVDGIETEAEPLAPAPGRQPEKPLRPTAKRNGGWDRPTSPTADRKQREVALSRGRTEQAHLLVEQRRLEAAWEARPAMGRQRVDEPATHPLRSLLGTGEWPPTAIDAKSPDLPLVETVLCEALPAADSASFAGHEGPILQSVLSPDGRWLATASADATVRLWNLHADPADSEAVVLRGHGGPVTSLAVSSDGHWLASAGFDGTAFLWRLTAENPAKSPIKFRTQAGRVHTLLLSPDGRWLITAGGIAGGTSSVAELWDLTSRRPNARSIELRGHERPILAAAVSSDSRWLATAGEDKTIRVWNLASRHPAAEQVVLHGHEGWIGTLAISPDCRWLVSGSFDATARLWRLDPLDPTAAPVVLRGHEGWVGTVAFSPNGRWLATAGFDRTVRLWEFRVERIDRSPRILTGHAGRIQSLAYTPDSRQLISGSFDATARLWDIAAEHPEEEAVVLRGHGGPVNTLSVSGDGRWLASGGGETFDNRDNTARLWDIGRASLAKRAHLLTAQRLAPGERVPLLGEAAHQEPAPRNQDEALAIPPQRPTARLQLTVE